MSVFYKILDFFKARKGKEKRIKQLEEEVFRWENITNTLPNSIYIKNIKGEYTWINQVSAEQLKNVHGVDFDILGKNDMEVFPLQAALEYMENDRSVIKNKIGSVHEESIVLSNGKELRRLSFKEPLYNKLREITGILGYTIDVTELVDLKEQLKASKIREAHFKAMSSIGGMMAHELRTPLTSIELSAQNLKDALPILVEAYRKYSKIGDVKKIREAYLDDLDEMADDIEQSARYAMNTITTILSGFHYSASEVAPMEEVDMEALIQEALESYPFSKKERELVSFSSSLHSKVLVSPGIVIHVLHNLLKNALYAITKSGKGVITISLDKTKENFIELVFTDTGEGISKGVQDHIFEPFYTTKDKETSVGLGLYFCKMALEKMGGAIICESQEGEYTSFLIRIKRPVFDEQQFSVE